MPDTKARDSGDGGEVKVAFGHLPYPDILVHNTKAVKKVLFETGTKAFTGDSTAAFASKRGLVNTSAHEPTHFTSYSMDVKFEGKNVARQMDMTLSGPSAKAVEAKIIAAGGESSNLKLQIPDGDSGGTRTVELQSAEIQRDPEKKARAIQDARRASGNQKIEDSQTVVLKVKL